MYKEMIINLAYKIMFDLDYFDSAFWFSSSFLWEVFIMFLGVKIGVSFLRQAFD